MNGHVQDRLSAYLDGELIADERAAVESHLRGCPGCARHLEELRAVDEAARGIDVVAPPGYFDALPGRVRARLAAPRRRAPPAWMWAAAAAIVLAALTPLMLPRMRAPLPQDARTAEADRAAPSPAGPAAVAPPAGTMPEPPPPAAAPPADARLDDLAASRDKAAGASGNMASESGSLGRRGREQEQKVQRQEPAPAQQAPPPQAPAQRHVGPWAQSPAPPQERPAPTRSGAIADEEAQKAVAEPGLKKEAEAAPAPAGKSDRDQAAGLAAAAKSVTAPGFAEPPGEQRYRALKDRPAPASAEVARRRHDEWEALARSEPDGPRADEARVRAIEASALAFDLGGDPHDRDRARAAAKAYLARADAAQAPRVRALLARLD